MSAQPSASFPTEAAFFTALASQTTIATIVTNPRLPDNPIIFANAAFQALTGYPEDETLGRNCRFLQGEETDPTAVAQVRAAVALGEPLEIDLQNRRKSGEIFWNRLMLSPIRDEAGEVAYFIGAQIDVTDRYAAQAETSKTAALLRTLIETAEGLIFAKDRDGRMLIANGPVLDMLGKPWTDVEGRTDLEFLDDPAQARIVMENDRQVMTGGERQVLEEEVTGLDGRPRIWLSTKTPMRDGAGAVSGIVGLSIDITERKVVEAKLRQLNETLEAQVAERTQALLDAEARHYQGQKMDAIGQLAGGIAHDFNNLLQAISGNLEILQRRIGRGEFENLGRAISQAQEAAARAGSLTNRLLAFGRRQALSPRAIDPDEMLDSFADLLQRTVGPNIAVVLDKHDGIWSVLCDPNQLESALLAAAINARDAMPNGGTLRIRTTDVHLALADLAGFEDAKPGDYVSIEMIDTGPGMAPEVAAQAFEPFFTTKPLGQGTGLGLSQLYGFVRQSGGCVEIESEVGGGTTVRIYLPRYLGAPNAPLPRRATPAQVQGTTTVLVVDDDDSVREVVVDTLRTLGCTVYEAGEGFVALNLMDSLESLDLLITDVGLPGLNGRQLADAARAWFPSLPVILITGYVGDAREGWDLASGMELLSKPFTLEALSDRVSSKLSRRLPE